MESMGYIIVTIVFQRIGRRWTAQCVELGTATFGRSLVEADEKMTEAILLHLNTLEDVNEREQFFNEHKIKFYPYKPKTRKVQISVPLDEKAFTRARIQPIPALADAS